MQKRIGAAVLAAAAIAVTFTGTFTGTAQAEYNPKCPSGVSQIGSTKYIKSGSATVASVKQFVGCGKNYGYIYVWDSWKASHSNFVASVGMATRDSDGEIDTNSGARGQQEVWSRGANTTHLCTRAYGHVSGGHNGNTGEVC